MARCDKILEALEPDDKEVKNFLKKLGELISACESVGIWANDIALQAQSFRSNHEAGRQIATLESCKEFARFIKNKVPGFDQRIKELKGELFHLDLVSRFKTES